jgi:nucleoside phosphorylase
MVAATERELFAVDDVETLCCGIGPVEAALATAAALAEGRPDVILHVGIAGAQTLEPGTVVVGTEAIYADVLDPNATLPRLDRVGAAPDLVAAVLEALPETRALPIATCARVGGGAGYEVEAMEGFGVLRAAALAGVPAIELRVISNAVAVADRALWRIDDALAILERSVRALVPGLNA